FDGACEAIKNDSDLPAWTWHVDPFRTGQWWKLSGDTLPGRLMTNDTVFPESFFANVSRGTRASCWDLVESQIRLINVFAKPATIAIQIQRAPVKKHSEQNHKKHGRSRHGRLRLGRVLHAQRFGAALGR